MRCITLTTVAALLLAAGCGTGTVTPGTDEEAIVLVPEYAASLAASVDAAGIGAAQLPPELALTAEQKAAIAELHEAFRLATAEDVAAL